MRFLETDWQISLFSLWLYVSTMATLMGTEESGHCREGETSQSECMCCSSIFTSGLIFLNRLNFFEPVSFFLNRFNFC